MNPLHRVDLEKKDLSDPLAPFRDKFQLPGQGLYFNGNSLGPRPFSTSAALEKLLQNDWGRKGGGAWNSENWLQKPIQIGCKIAALMGAGEDEVIVADSTSINLAKMILTGLALRPDRTVIVTERTNFPTDLYILQEIVAQRPGLTLRVVEKDELAAALDEKCAMLVLTHVNYRTANVHDMALLTKLAHAAGAVALWDLSHSVGAVNLHLSEWDVDLAIGCGYKFLNGGPGAPAFLYVAKKYQDQAKPALPGWMGHSAPFDFSPVFQPAASMRRHLTGTPPVLALTALDCGVDLMVEAGIEAVTRKSQALGDVMIQLVDERLSHTDIRVLSPRKAGQRGAQISLTSNHAAELVKRLEAKGLVMDFRPPNIIRLGLAALYVRFQDLWDVVTALDAEWIALRD